MSKFTAATALSVFTALINTPHNVVVAEAKGWRTPLDASVTPSIAIVTLPSIDCPTPPAGLSTQTGQCVNGRYVDWLAAAGVRVVPLEWDLDIHAKRRILGQVNGVIFPGGDLDEYPDVYPAYFARAREILQYGLERNRPITNSDSNNTTIQDPFLVWGTCQGFQVLSAAADGAKGLDAIQNKVYSAFGMLPLEFVDDMQGQGRFLNEAAGTPVDVIDAVTNYTTTLNAHHDGLTPDQYAPNTTATESTAYESLLEKAQNNFADMEMGDLWKITTINHDPTNGRPFASTMEARHGMNMFAVQWHPEWTAFEWGLGKMVPHTEQSLRVSQYVADFIRQRLMLSLSTGGHQWSTPEALEASVIQNYPVSYVGWGKYVYWPHASWALNTSVQFVRPSTTPSSTSSPPVATTQNSDPSPSSSSSSPVSTTTTDVDPSKNETTGAPDADATTASTAGGMSSSVMIAGVLCIVALVVVYLGYQQYTAFDKDLKDKVDAHAKSQQESKVYSDTCLKTVNGQIVRGNTEVIEE